MPSFAAAASGVLCMALTALGQSPEINSADGTLTMTVGDNGEVVARRQATQNVNVFELSTVVAQLETVTSTLAAAQNDGTVNDMIARIATSAVSATTSVSRENAELAAEVSFLRESVASMASQIAASAATTASQLDAQNARVEGALRDANISLGRQMDSMRAENQNQINVMNQAVNNLNLTMNTALANVRPMRNHIWKGGCSGRRHGGWNWYCLDRREIDTSAPYFRMSNTGLGRWTAIQNNIMVEVSFFTIGTSCNWQHSYLDLNGRTKYGTHSHASSRWEDSYVITTIQVPAGQWWAIKTHAACGHVSSYEYGTHSSITSTFVGL